MWSLVRAQIRSRDKTIVGDELSRTKIYIVKVIAVAKTRKVVCVDASYQLRLSLPPKTEPSLFEFCKEQSMARKRYSDEDILKLLREIELHIASGCDVATACRSAGVSDATYYNWRKKFGGMGRSQLSELKSLEKENQRLKKIVADLELDKLILRESLDFLKPKA